MLEDAIDVDDDHKMVDTKSNNDETIAIGDIRAKYNDSKGCDHWVGQYPKTIGKSGKRYTMA